MAPILTIFGPNRSRRRDLFFEKVSKQIDPENFKRPTNREDGSDFDDFLTKTIGAPTKKISRQRKNRSERTTKQRRTKKFTGGRFATNLFVGYKI